MFDSLGAAETYWIPVRQSDPDAAQDPEVVEQVAFDGISAFDLNEFVDLEGVSA